MQCAIKSALSLFVQRDDKSSTTMTNMRKPSFQSSDLKPQIILDIDRLSDSSNYLQRV